MGFELPEADDARRFLVSLLGRDVGPVERVGEGAWSRCFAFDHAGRELVARFGRHRTDFEKDRLAARFASPALPIPEVLEVGAAFGGAFAISARVRGEPLEALPPARFARTLPSLLAAFDAQRAADLSERPGWGAWDARGRGRDASWRDFLLGVGGDRPGERIAGWRPKLARTPEAESLFAAGLARLAACADGLPVERSLVHADWINRNAFVANERIAGVFDWGCSLHGDFLYDFAWLGFWAPWHPAIEAAGIRDVAERHFEAIGLEVPELERRWRACELHIGLDHLRYNAHTGDRAALDGVAARLAPLVQP